MLSIILPAYNEEKNIELTLNDISDFIKKLQIPFEIIVVNDGSKDHTTEILNICAKKFENLNIVTHPKNLGYGTALRSGFAKAEGDLIFFTDSDHQFDIQDIVSFLEKIKEYDFVVGYRKNRQDPYFRILYASIFRLLTHFLFGVKVHDVNCAFKLFRKEVIKGLPLISSGALINLEIFTLAKKKGYKFIELPVKHFPRQSGRQTGGNIKVLLKAVFNVFFLWLRIQKIK